MSFLQKLTSIEKKQHTLVCVGLDSDIQKIPERFRAMDDGQFQFNKAIIDATHDLVSAYKPNSAFYEGRGSEGINQLKLTCDYIRSTYPEVCLVLDAKRADIGSTNSGYIQYAYEYLGVDAVTLHPYLGKEALQPFLDREDKGCIVLCRTSNSGAGEFQDLSVDGEPLYIKIAKRVVSGWNAKSNCLLVVGATYPKELSEIRKIAGDMTFLVPGIGAQGGDIKDSVTAGVNSEGAGMIINSSRGIIFASAGADFAEKARYEAENMRNEINRYRQA